MSERAAPPSVTLMYEGWQVWDGVYGPVRVGEEFTASVEFVQRSPLSTVELAAEPHVEPLIANRYLATARVLDTADAVVLDLGSLRALRWVRPGESAGDFVAGTTVSLELSLNLNAWDCRGVHRDRRQCPAVLPFGLRPSRGGSRQGRGSAPPSAGPPNPQSRQ